MSEDKALHTVPFDRKTSSYMNWSKRFLSLCNIKECDQALLQEYADNLIHNETSTMNYADQDYAEKKEIMKANRLAY
jgi:hypothetical protein